MRILSRGGYRKIIFLLICVAFLWMFHNALFGTKKQSAHVDTRAGKMWLRNHITLATGSGYLASWGLYTLPSKRYGQGLENNPSTSHQLKDLPKDYFKDIVPSKQKDIVSLELYPDIIDRSLGDGGLPAVLPSRLQNISKLLFNNHSFDSILSDRISMNRILPDARGERCREKHNSYSLDLPTTSVIICFHNEALSALLRTVHSVLNKTPPKLLADIVLVDDRSIYGSLGEPLTKYIRTLNGENQVNSKIKLLRNKERQGLVRSRLKGASLAKGDVLTFLDSHCEVTNGWIEPLLDRIKEDKRNVVCPVIEVIDASDFSYKKSEISAVTQVGGFTWDLFFNWKEIPLKEKEKRKDFTLPLKSPTMAGGLFSINRKYFYDIGSYDPEMDIWGGENLEMSFRIWMCGGNLEIIPCSRVGHIFRKKNSPYSFPGGVSKVLARNFNRLAEVWMDEYKELYYRRKARADRIVAIGNIEERKALRQRLHCRSFKWYIENIVPDMIGADPHPPAHGEIKNVKQGRCVDSMGAHGNRGNLKMYGCHGLGNNQFFVMTKRGEITFNDEKCLDFSFENPESRIELWDCHGLKGNQEWQHDNKKGVIRHAVSKRCLGYDSKDFIVAKDCSSDLLNPSQLWEFGHYREKLW